MRRLLPCLSLLACTSEPPAADDPAEDTDPGVEIGVWEPGLPVAAEAIAPLRGRVHQRAVFHLHSPWSHDACDGKAGTVEDLACLADLRAGLCATRFDLAYFTDHPDYGAAQTFEALLHPQPGDVLVTSDAGDVRLEVDCGDGHVVRWMPGFEDVLMPVGLDAHVDDDEATRHDLLNRSDEEAFRAMQEAGAHVMLAHTEGRDLATLERFQDLGLHAVEVFNAHAMFHPNIRRDDLGLDPTGWAADAGPFLAGTPGVVPDLFFLSAHEEQTVSVQRWDALLQRGPMMITAGTDAHQNTFPAPLSDGERGDSYRRLLRWFSTMLVTDDRSFEAAEAAIAARRAFVVFEALGTPTGFDLHVEADGEVFEMGADAPEGELVVSCPKLAPGSPRGEEAPEVRVVVYKDGEPWQSACGRYAVGPGVYRVRVDVVPHHLATFLGDVADRMVRPYPWIYSGAIRVGLGGAGG